tara:strand:+ start:16305 stop:17003 length:699 start_codon:yes stop_codon:yes gene_type:complete
MLNSTIVIKVKQRINKLDSQDYDNLECWQIVEAFNKAQVEWCRRQLHGLNIVKEGDEQSTRRKDDLQVLLTTDGLTVTDKKDYFFGNVPTDYLQWKRVDVLACKDCCDDRRMTVYLAEEGNLNQLLRDKAKKPSFEWAETFATLINNQVHIYTNDEFDISQANLIYYRQPRRIQLQGCVDPYTNEETLVNVESEFKDDIIELIIDETVSVLAGDIESPVQYPRGTQTAERNN